MQKVINFIGQAMLVISVSFIGLILIARVNADSVAEHQLQEQKLDEMCAQQYETFKTPLVCIGRVKTYDQPLPLQG